jgi:hypothetical protein
LNAKIQLDFAFTPFPFWEILTERVAEALQSVVACSLPDPAVLVHRRQLAGAEVGFFITFAGCHLHIIIKINTPVNQNAF